MRNNIIYFVFGCILLSCTAGNTTYPNRTQYIPNQSLERTASSVSPRAETQYSGGFAESQGPRNLYPNSVLEPMRSITTRSRADVSEEDATVIGDAVNNTNRALKNTEESE